MSRRYLIARKHSPGFYRDAIPRPALPKNPCVLLENGHKQGFLKCGCELGHHWLKIPSCLFANFSLTSNWTTSNGGFFFDWEMGSESVTGTQMFRGKGNRKWTTECTLIFQMGNPKEARRPAPVTNTLGLSPSGAFSQPVVPLLPSTPTSSLPDPWAKAAGKGTSKCLFQNELFHLGKKKVSSSWTI